MSLRTQIIKKVSNRTGIHEKDVKLVIDFFIDELIEKIVNRKKVTISGFGSFEHKELKARSYTHPQNPNVIVDVPDRIGIKFNMSSVIRRMLNEEKRT